MITRGHGGHVDQLLSWLYSPVLGCYRNSDSRMELLNWIENPAEECLPRRMNLKSSTFHSHLRIPLLHIKYLPTLSFVDIEEEDDPWILIGLYNGEGNAGGKGWVIWDRNGRRGKLYTMRFQTDYNIVGNILGPVPGTPREHNDEVV